MLLPAGYEMKILIEDKLHLSYHKSVRVGPLSVSRGLILLSAVAESEREHFASSDKGLM